MNANELADMLEEVDAVYNEQYLQPATTMLRQQQAREDSLCSMVKEYQDKVDELRAEIEALKSKLNKYHLKEDLDRNLNLIYGKEFIK